MNVLTLRECARTLLLAAAVVGAVCLVGCGGEDNPADDNSAGGGSNNCTSADSCKSAVMPDGKRWMTENLNVVTANSWCYENSASNCRKYGRLYTWSAANAACPAGWHLPSGEEWDALIDSAGGRTRAGWRLKSTSGWDYDSNGSDDYGFSALPGGKQWPGVYFTGAGTNGCWWTATEFYRDSYYDNEMNSSGGLVLLGRSDEGFGYSVRCVEDQ